MESLFFPPDQPERNRARRHARLGDHGITRSSVAKWLYWSRTIRPDDGIRKLYGEPVWDILLDLYIHDSEARRVSVNSLCIGSGAAPTTALRYMTILIERGWIVRECDETDHRRTFVHLSKSARDQMNHYLDTIMDKIWSITPDALVETASGDFAQLMSAVSELLAELRAQRCEREDRR